MAADTPYSVRFKAPTLLPKSVETTVSVSIEHDGAVPTVTGVKFSLFSPSGEKLIDSATASESAGVLSYAVPAAKTSDQNLGKGYLVRFECTIASYEHMFTNNACVVKHKIYCPIGTSDLVARYSQIAQLQSGGATSELQPFVDEAWTEIQIKLYSGSLEYWKIRSPGNLRDWVLTRALSLALADLALLVGNGGPYRDESRRLEGTLKAKYEGIRSLLDLQEQNILTDQQTTTSGVIQLSTGRGVYRGYNG